MDGKPPATWQPTYVWRDPRWFEFDRETLSDLRLRAADASQGMPLPPYKFIIHTPQLKTGLPVRNGLARAGAGALWLLFQRGRTTCLLGVGAALALCSRQVGPPVFAQMQAIAVLKQMLCDSKKLWVFVGFLAVKSESHLVRSKNGGMRVCAKMTQNKCDSVLKHYGGV